MWLYIGSGFTPFARAPSDSTYIYTLLSHPPTYLPTSWAVVPAPLVSPQACSQVAHSHSHLCAPCYVDP